MRFVLLLLPLMAAGCGGGSHPLFDKTGATRDEEFKDRVACINTRQGFLVPQNGVVACMQEKGYKVVATEI